VAVCKISLYRAARARDAFCDQPRDLAGSLVDSMARPRHRHRLVLQPAPRDQGRASRRRRCRIGGLFEEATGRFSYIVKRAAAVLESQHSSRRNIVVCSLWDHWAYEIISA
jgi:hypothetical protein